MGEEKSNKDLVEEKLKEQEEKEDKNSLSYIVKKYRLLLIYCGVVLTYYIIRYVVFSSKF